MAKKTQHTPATLICKNSFEWDEISDRAVELVKEGKSIFLTGKAGTGKTTLLEKRIVNELKGKKEIVVLAPTGVAACNAKGSTIHSFLHLPLVPFLPHHNLKDLYNLDENQAVMIKMLDIIIVDEISMVRCDVLDAVDAILRHYRGNKKPFGGIQMIFIGDLFQLMPVANYENMKILKEGYPEPYFFFFSEVVSKKLDYRVIELQKVHRQKDREFVDLLNKARVGETTELELEKLESLYDPSYIPDVKSNIIKLMTHNDDMKDYNNLQLSKLKADEKKFWAIIEGAWDYKDRYGKLHIQDNNPTNRCLRLKVGARVMFVKNDALGLYHNGTLGRVKKIRDNSIDVVTDQGQTITVEKHTWEKYEYTLNKKTKTIETKIVGTFRQFPLKLAWAITIHKSQGLTFSNVVIDAAKSFSEGQVYVALSRCKSLKGIVLSTIIPKDKINAHPIVMEYMNSIDEEGKVHYKLPDVDEEIERKPLRINVSWNRFQNIKKGKKHEIEKSILDSNLARQILRHDSKGNLIVIDKYKNTKEKWSIYDQNNGHFPFIMRKYKSLIVEMSQYLGEIEIEILSSSVVGLDTHGNWRVKYRFGKVLKIKSFQKD